MTRAVDAALAMLAASSAAAEELLELVDPDEHATAAAAAVVDTWPDEVADLITDHATTITRRLALGELDEADVGELLGTLTATAARLGALTSLAITRDRYIATHRATLELEQAIRAPSAPRP